MKPSFNIQSLERISTQKIKSHHQTEISYKYNQDISCKTSEVYQNQEVNCYKLLNIKDLQIEIKQDLYAQYKNTDTVNIHFIYSYIMKNIDSNINFNNELGLKKANNENSNNQGSNMLNIKSITSNGKNDLIDVEIYETYNYTIKPKSLEELKNFLNHNKPSKYYNIKIKNAPSQNAVCQMR